MIAGNLLQRPYHHVVRAAHSARPDTVLRPTTITCRLPQPATGDWHLAESVAAGGPYDCILDCAGADSLLTQVHRDRLLGYRGVIAPP